MSFNFLAELIGSEKKLKPTESQEATSSLSQAAAGLFSSSKLAGIQHITTPATLTADELLEYIYRALQQQIAAAKINQLIDLAIEKKCDLNQCTQLGWTLLAYAAYQKNIAVVSHLLPITDVEQPCLYESNARGCTPLIAAVELTESLCEQTKMTRSVLEKRSALLVYLLHQYGANLHKGKGRHASTALHTAAIVHNNSAMTALVVCGAQNTPRDDGMTPLLLTFYEVGAKNFSSNQQIVDALCRILDLFGTKTLTEQDHKGNNIDFFLDKIKSMNKELYILLIEQLEIYHKNFRKSAKKPLLTTQNELMHSALIGNLELVKKIIKEHSINPDQKNIASKTALTEATRGGQIATVNYLLESKANVNQEGFLNYTALHYAAQQGHNEILLLLIYSGANFYLNHGENKTTPLILAMQNGHLDTVQLLLEYFGNDILWIKDNTEKDALHYAHHIKNFEFYMALKKWSSIPKPERTKDCYKSIKKPESSLITQYINFSLPPQKSAAITISDEAFDRRNGFFCHY